MSENVFIDTNVLLDVLAQRKDFYKHAAAIWTLAERGMIRGLVSAISFNNIYYVIRKLRGAQTASQALAKLRNVFEPITLDAQLLGQAIDADFDDFEDAIQYYSAVRAEASCIVSRNAQHFPASDRLPVLSPAEYLVRVAGTK